MNQISKVLAVTLVCTATQRINADDVDFNRDIRPLLAAKCFACHGPDEEAREAELRLDSFEAATGDRDGSRAIVPGDAVRSELVLRVTSDDPDAKMPPPDSGESLSEKQIELLTAWIRNGAKYEKHWAFLPPHRPALPERNIDKARNAIDRFESSGIDADHYSLLRRVFLDLAGMPPTPAEADAFVADDRPDAYERQVDRLLASPRYGERRARGWLDLARYSDTNGYEKDRPRSIWPYRDWVINALNADMPYDQFSIEQLAGDMIPKATNSQRVATGFHRNTMLNEEGGIDPLEFRYYAMVDRVATTGTVSTLR